MTTNVKKNGTKDYVTPVWKPLLNGEGRPVTTTVQTPRLEEAGIPTEELWPPKKEPRVSRIWKGAKKAWKENIGLLLVAASQAFFSLMNVSVKKLNSIDPPVSALQLVFVRMMITWLCCISYMMWAKVPDPILGPKEVRLLLAFRGFTGFFGLFGVYYSLQYLSLSDATVLTFLSPMTTAIAGALLLGERFSWKQAAAGFVSLGGVVLIARPASLFGGSGHDPLAFPDDGGLPVPSEGHRVVTSEQRLMAIAVALLGVLGATGAYTSLRAIGKRAHPLHALTSFSLQSVFVSGVAMAIRKDQFIIPTRAEWIGMFLLIGFFGFFAQVLLTMGLQRETASRGSMAIYTQIVFATIFERVFFNAVPSLLSSFGTLLIVTSAIYVAVRLLPLTGLSTAS
ncbi:DUF6-domain-containing protein [Coprinellus micaceus]|uniref:DUF6-domain-containing protein n=1 Tax=Coprinellus micaceus TaxID=71717 RepID=A0A4Y7SX96_COPMI|nr:DUF6-domain-containing protein [Coprinellus micaceus]